VLGRNAEGSVDEDVTCKPVSPYGLSKLVSEGYGKIYSELYGLNISIARIFNVYGPGLQHLFVCDMIRKIKKGGVVKFFGDGSQVRDYLYISDLVRAVDTVVRKGEPGNVYNICSGEPIELIEMCQKISALIGGVDLKLEFSDPLEGDINKWYGNTNKLKSLGFEPEVPLEEGLEMTIRGLL
jgi:nucleoside-diphosphate-sugar epimerase